MNSLAKLILLIAGSLAVAACGKTPPNVAADTSAIRSSQDAWYKSYNSGDGASVAALYADDAVLMAPNVPAARGIAAIRDYYSTNAPQFQASGLTAVEGPAGDIGISGDLAWQGTTYTVTDKSGATVEAGKVLTVLQRRDGKWMIIRDTWNSDAAPATGVAYATTSLKCGDTTYTVSTGTNSGTCGPTTGTGGQGVNCTDGGKLVSAASCTAGCGTSNGAGSCLIK